MPKNKNLETSLCGQRLVSPLILASGILGTEAQLMLRVAKTGAGAVTSKSCCWDARKGHENPTILAWEHGLINAVGLSNPGVKAQVKELKKLRLLLNKEKLDTKIIASFFGSDIDEFVAVAQELVKSEPDFLEANISCPNVASEFGQMFAASVIDTSKLVKKVKKVVGDIPLIVKISPNVTDIKSIAVAAENAGADAIAGINTLLGMIIDIESSKPILTNKMGGVSGPAIRPVALCCVYQIYQAVKIPIIGLGGVDSGNTAIEMMMAGSTAVGVGSATYEGGINVFKKINKQIIEYLENHKISNIKKIIGRAHEN